MIPLQKIVCAPPRGERDALKVGVFAGLHGDEPAGMLACRQLVDWVREKPEDVLGYSLVFYPECNPGRLQGPDPRIPQRTRPQPRILAQFVRAGDSLPRGESDVSNSTESSRSIRMILRMVSTALSAERC